MGHSSLLLLLLHRHDCNRKNNIFLEFLLSAADTTTQKVFMLSKEKCLN